MYFFPTCLQNLFVDWLDQLFPLPFLYWMKKGKARYIYIYKKSDFFVHVDLTYAFAHNSLNFFKISWQYRRTHFFGTFIAISIYFLISGPPKGGNARMCRIFTFNFRKGFFFASHRVFLNIQTPQKQTHATCDHQKKKIFGYNGMHSVISRPPRWARKYFFVPGHVF